MKLRRLISAMHNGFHAAGFLNPEYKRLLEAPQMLKCFSGKVFADLWQGLDFSTAALHVRGLSHTTREQYLWSSSKKKLAKEAPLPESQPVIFAAVMSTRALRGNFACSHSCACALDIRTPTLIFQASMRLIGVQCMANVVSVFRRRANACGLCLRINRRVTGD